MEAIAPLEPVIPAEPAAELSPGEEPVGNEIEETGEPEPDARQANEENGQQRSLFPDEE